MEQTAGGNNGINNYKGVMLCSRPNQAVISPIEKPFCGRVVPPEQLGLVPIKEQRPHVVSPTKPKLEALDKHKKWLDHFKKDIQNKNKQAEENKQKQSQRIQRIKQQAEMDRQRSRKMREQYNQTATNVLNILDDDTPVQINNELTPENLQRLNKANQTKTKNYSPAKQINKAQNNFKKNKKNQKPLWAQTQQQVQQNQEAEVDELLDFFSTNHVQDYAENDQVKDILSNLKEKIQKLKEQSDWKEKQMQRINKRKQQREKKPQQQQDNDDDKVTNFSAHSQSRSVASQKTQQKIQQLKAKKKEQQEWDKYTTSQKSTVAGIDERIAKNIADEVLRNYPNMKGVHSNVSIRRLLQAEAARVMNEPIARPIITTIIKQKNNKIDANNLPYLHRNPAI